MIGSHGGPRWQGGGPHLGGKVGIQDSCVIGAGHWNEHTHTSEGQISTLCWGEPVGSVYWDFPGLTLKVPIPGTPSVWNKPGSFVIPFLSEILELVQT